MLHLLSLPCSEGDEKSDAVRPGRFLTALNATQVGLACMMCVEIADMRTTFARSAASDSASGALLSSRRGQQHKDHD